MEFAAATGTAANATVCCRQDSWTGVVKITGTHNKKTCQMSDCDSDCDSDMSQDSRVKTQESRVKKSLTNSQFPIPNSLGNSEFLGNSNFLGIPIF